MVPWIQIYSNLLTHDKTYTLAEKLKIQIYGAAGIMVGLWCWAAVNAPDGDITRYPSRAISDAVKWNRKPDVLYNALLEVQLLEETEDQKIKIRNWESYATLLMDMAEEQKRKTNERVKRLRERKKESEISECNVTVQNSNDLEADKCSVTETLRNAPTEPNITINNKYDADDDTSVCFIRAREGVKIVDSVNCVDNVDNLVGMTNELKTQVQKLSERHFTHYFNRKPSAEDVAWVWLNVRDKTRNGTWQISHDKTAILEYAFTEASKASSPNIKYIDGMYRNFAQRGLQTMDDIVQYDFERDRETGRI